MFSRTQFEVGTIFGVPVKLDLSLILLAGSFVFSARGAGLRASLVVGLLCAAALLLAILVHELGHALAAKAFGCRVGDITLMFFGGYATIYNQPRDPWKDAALALAGPVAGFVLWRVAAIAAALLPDDFLASFLSAVSVYSLYLSLFNLIPAFPLDGGRVLRAVLTRFRGRLYAARLSCRIAYVLAIAMGRYGLFHRSFMLVFIAFFVWSAARSELGSLNRYRGADDDDDTVIISPPPYGGDTDYTRINRER